MEWQPIETAPKDGTRILMWSQKHSSVSYDSWADFCRMNNPSFTHWMPLPPPPPSEAK